MAFPKKSKKKKNLPQAPAASPKMPRNFGKEMMDSGDGKGLQNVKAALPFGGGKPGGPPAGPPAKMMPPKKKKTKKKK